MIDEPMEVDSLPTTQQKTRKKAAIIRYEGKEGKATRLGKGGGIHYYSDSVIGQGATSIVYAGYFETESRKAAVKRLESRHYDIYNDELNILRQVSHTNIICYFATKEWNEQGRDLYYIAMELADITLDDCVNSKTSQYRHTSDNTLLEYIKGTANGLSFLHSKRIIHRDVKPTNILIKDGVSKLVDFGISKKIESTNEGTNSLGKGTCDWMAPEALKSQDEGKPFFNTPSVDIFSFGLTIYYTFTEGQHAFGSPIMRAPNIMCNHMDLCKFTDSQNYRHAALQNLVVAMLKKEPENRPKINAIVSHPFFWNSKRKLDFITIVSNTSLKDGDLATLLDNAFKKASPLFDWRLKCSPKVDKFINSHKKKYPGHSFVKLVEFIRDKQQHIADWPDDIKTKDEFGAGQNDIETYVQYFEQRVPKMITFLYVHMQKSSKKYLEYYKHNEHKYF